MRCDDVTRALAAPADGVDRDAVAAHLAGCPACASWAERDAALTRAWDATRPNEPNEAAWDGLWASVSDGLDRRASAPIPRSPRVFRLRQSWAAAVVVAAQAAAVLLAVGTWDARHGNPGGPEGPTHLMAQAEAPVDIDSGEFVVIRAEGRGVRPVEIAYDARPNALDDLYAAYNRVEGMAE
jgi:hypothetical protein